MNYDTDIQFSELTMQIDAYHVIYETNLSPLPTVSLRRCRQRVAVRHLSTEQLQIANRHFIYRYNL